MLFAPERYRKKIFICVIIGMLGCVYVADTQFLDRMTTIVSSEETRDSSAQSRLDLWAAGIRMTLDRAVGIGVGNWYYEIGRYVPEFEGKDSHSTYVKCIAELGVHGFLLFVLYPYIFDFKYIYIIIHIKKILVC